eukprot:jgi/Psemu1/225351/e_gw1.1596.9.1
MEEIKEIAKEVLGWPECRKWNSRDMDRRFRSCFGCPSSVVVTIWNRILAHGPIESGRGPKHLLDTLFDCWMAICNDLFKWAWYFVRRIAELKDELISLDNRFDGLNGVAHTTCFMSVDGTDCPVFEPWPFSKKMYSHKFNGPAVKYEVGVCLKTGWIVWINGPFVGSKNDGTIFKEGLSNLLHDNEAVEVDRDYRGDDKMKLPDVGFTRIERKMKSNARAQHETVNGRLKIFNVVTLNFRHMKPNRQGMMQKHKICFEAVAVITQLKFASGETTFKDRLEYDVNYF